MRGTRAWLMLGVAVVAGLIAVVAASHWINQQSQISASKIVVLGVDLQLGSRITGEMLRLADWPSGSIPPGAFHDPKELDGRVVKTSLQRGEPVLESKLAPLGTKGGLSAVVTEGKRAITVRVNDVVGVAGFALPGNYVDIMVSTQQENAKAGHASDATISKIVLEKILVLAVAQEASRDETKPKVVNAVTLEVTPQQAEKLDLARSVGTLSLVLRNQVDGTTPRTAGAKKQDLFQASAPQPEKPRGDKRVAKGPAVKTVAVSKDKEKIEMIKGTTKSAVEF